MDRPVLALTWAEFDEAVDHLAGALSGAGVERVYGVPRGGLCLAVALSHRLRVPLIDHPAPGALVVDDIYDTGQTMEALRGYGRTLAVWAVKGSPAGVIAARACHSDQWLVFPWEDPSNAQTEQEVFRDSRQ